MVTLIQSSVLLPIVFVFWFVCVVFSYNVCFATQYIIILVTQNVVHLSKILMLSTSVPRLACQCVNEEIRVCLFVECNARSVWINIPIAGTSWLSIILHWDRANHKHVLPNHTAKLYTNKCEQAFFQFMFGHNNNKFNLHQQWFHYLLVLC